MIGSIPPNPFPHLSLQQEFGSGPQPPKPFPHRQRTNKIIGKELPKVLPFSNSPFIVFSSIWIFIYYNMHIKGYGSGFGKIILRAE